MFRSEGGKCIISIISDVDVVDTIEYVFDRSILHILVDILREVTEAESAIKIGGIELGSVIVDLKLTDADARRLDAVFPDIRELLLEAAKQRGFITDAILPKYLPEVKDTYGNLVADPHGEILRALILSISSLTVPVTVSHGAEEITVVASWAAPA